MGARWGAVAPGIHHEEGGIAVAEVVVVDPGGARVGVGLAVIDVIGGGGMWKGRGGVVVVGAKVVLE